MLIPNCLSDYPFLNESETPTTPKSNNSIKSLKCCKTQILSKMAAEEPSTILETLRAEIVALNLSL